MLDLLRSIAYVATFTWQLAYGLAMVLHIAVLLGYRFDRLRKAADAAAQAHQELWLFAPAGLVYAAVDSWNSPRPWTIVFVPWGLLIWWWARNWPDDNVWKRRRKKLRDAVKAVGGRLVVVPAGAAS